ncbi:hypothetical protein [Vaginisenegalia massiliensis]|uniref:hypothetical protein n=1 Tax=Vaginisenegalia massiliensis TaxID=2058294 RepID=UPI0013DE6F45|nr:hypothetical protein [Vaginisenegalia massiliensis]
MLLAPGLKAMPAVIFALQALFVASSNAQLVFALLADSDVDLPTQLTGFDI